MLSFHTNRPIWEDGMESNLDVGMPQGVQSEQGGDCYERNMEKTLYSSHLATGTKVAAGLVWRPSAARLG